MDCIQKNADRLGEINILVQVVFVLQKSKH